MSEQGARAACGVAMSLVAATATLWNVAAADDWESITEERLLDPEPGDWLSYRRTYDVTGFSPLSQINRRNIGDLRPVWTYSLRDNGRWVATPIVANGLMYVAEGSGRVLAFDVPTGEVVWIYTRTFPADVAKSEGYPRARGVAILGDTIYWGTPDMHLVALDARTGAVRFDVQTGDYTTGEGHAHPPLIAGGRSSSAPPAATWARAESFRRAMRRPVRSSGSSIPSHAKESPATRLGRRTTTGRRSVARPGTRSATTVS